MSREDAADELSEHLRRNTMNRGDEGDESDDVSEVDEEDEDDEDDVDDEVDDRPRGRISAFGYFVQAEREEYKKLHPDEVIVYAEFSRKCAKRWETMLDEEKKPFIEMGERDKERWDKQMELEL